jgi:hypothetical protein
MRFDKRKLTGEIELFSAWNPVMVTHSPGGK